MTTWTRTPPSFVRTPSGDEIVILQREDYDRLLEAAASHLGEDDDEEDLAIAREKEKEWVAAGRPVVPLAVLKFVRTGDTYMRAFRKFRCLTQGELSVKTGIAQGFLSDIEGARKNASMASLQKIADALDMHVSLLIPMTDGTSAEGPQPEATCDRTR